MLSTHNQTRFKLVWHILQFYGIEYVHISVAQKGYRNYIYAVTLTDSEVIAVILYKRESGMLAKIKEANRLGSYLSGQGLPVRRPWSNQIIKLSSNNGVTYAGLYDYLPGQTIPWETYSQSHIKLLGSTMAQMHKVLKPLPQQQLPLVTEEYINLVHRMVAYFRGDNIQKALRTKLNLNLSSEQIEQFLPLLAGSHKLKQQQPLHMDFVRSNILFNQVNEGSQTNDLAITGILDLEKAAYGHLLFDVARTLAFLLVDCKFKAPDKVRKYFLSGYVKYGQNNLERVTIKYINQQELLLDKLIDMFLLYDFYKFLLHNPYEFLPQNEHFLRTRDLLINRRLVLPSKTY